MSNDSDKPRPAPEPATMLDALKEANALLIEQRKSVIVLRTALTYYRTAATPSSDALHSLNLTEHALKILDFTLESLIKLSQSQISSPTPPDEPTAHQMSYYALAMSDVTFFTLSGLHFRHPDLIPKPRTLGASSNDTDGPPSPPSDSSSPPPDPTPSEDPS